MSTIVTRAGKGSPLTWNEVDNNFTNLNTDKIQSGNTVAALTITSATINGGSINGTSIGGSTAAAGTFTSLSDSGNLTFTGTGNRITGDFSNATVANRVNFQTSTTNGGTYVSTLPLGTGNISGFFAYNAADGDNASVLGAYLTNAVSIINSSKNGTGSYLPMTFYTGGSERMRIDTSGNVLVGKTSTSDSVAGIQLSSVSGGASNVHMVKTVSGGINAWLNYYNGTYVGGINFDNTSSGFVTSSDYRLKDNIADASEAMNKVSKIKVRSFDWKLDDSHVEYGFIAQELNEIAPQAIMVGTDNEDGSMNIPWSVDYSKLVPLLTKAIQEQQAIIEQLKADVEALKGAK